MIIEYDLTPPPAPLPPDPQNVVVHFEIQADGNKLTDDFWMDFRSWIAEDIHCRIKTFLEEKGVLCSKP